MLPALSNKTDFYKHYWNYYLSIERSFLSNGALHSYQPEKF